MVLSQMLKARHLYAQVRDGQIFAVAGQPNYWPRTCGYFAVIHLLFLPASVNARAGL